MKNSYRRKRAINFDLHNLEKYYSKTNPRKAYKEIEKFMEKYEFEHVQYSGYYSEKPYSNAELLEMIDEMFEQFPWLDQCVRRMNVTEYGQLSDVMKYRSERLKSMEKPLKEMKKKKSKTR